MGYEAQDAAIEDYFGTNYSGLEQIKWDNVAFDPPIGETYFDFQIHDGNSFPASFSGDSITERNVGIVSINIYGPEGTGTRAIKAIADDVAAVLRYVQTSGVTFRNPSIKRLGLVNKRHVINVSIPFWRDEVFAVP